MFLETFPVTKFGAIVESESLSLCLRNMLELRKCKRREELGSHFKKKEGDMLSTFSIFC